jgi:hypothetical protein
VARHRRRCRADRREVTVPCRVLPAEDVSGTLGCLFPVRPWRPRARDPSGVTVFDRAQRCDSLGNPLLGFSPPTRCCPPSPPPVSRLEAPLLGFRAASTLEEERVHVPIRLPGGRPGFAGVSAGRSHPAHYGVARRFFQPLSDFFLSPPSPHFQRGGVRAVRPSGVSSSRRSSDGSSPPAYPHDVLPTGHVPPVPRRGNP